LFYIECFDELLLLVDTYFNFRALKISVKRSFENEENKDRSAVHLWEKHVNHFYQLFGQFIAKMKVKTVFFSNEYNSDHSTQKTDEVGAKKVRKST
jgi:hypothetical protein